MKYPKQLQNKTLLLKLKKASHTLAPANNTQSSHLWMLVQLSISKLALQEHRYRLAYKTLDKLQKQLQKKPSAEIQAWTTYYYARYYTQINQQQLADTYLRRAEEKSEQLNMLKLSIQVNASIAKMYQSKHRFSRANSYAKKRVDLYLDTSNTIKQAHSMILLATLQRQNNQTNQSLIYLLNALELIQNNNNSFLLARIYLEIGRTYVAQISSSDDQKELQLAQKYLQNARYQFTKIQRPHYLIEVFILLARINIINQDPGLAILQLKKSLKISSDNNMEPQENAYKMLALSYELTSEHQQAIVYFKKFNALQNKIKMRLFAVQQLQISEQLQLFEQTQQYKELQAENRRLQTRSQQLKTLAYSTLSILIAVLFYLGSTLLRNKNLLQAEHRYQKKITFHPRTKLPWQNAENSPFQRIYKGKKLYYALVNVPFLSNINEEFGTNSGVEIEINLGKMLQQALRCDSYVFQMRDDQILIVSTQKKSPDSQKFALTIFDFFNDFSKKHHLNSNVSVGLVTFPFLNNASRAITPAQVLNINSIALSVANQIREEKNQSSWVELYAIDNLQPAFFDGDIWEMSQVAIQKGLIKMHSSSPIDELFGKK
ncbi:hypothetical protein PCNPT3_09575 [Psychromonas sp. CNPT3]|uniref:tetratricopeptide repeat protein n=1 Tax=Psychromonas sp. CNPT3 TaxID=314282 RepID=UPI00006E915F|nr:diguanylate cyclase [Psychromonas sp. CNPT3]AGH81853.1 hypothetical protein PCNPT3_09575 [Psychromonas sp. CNPT3]